MLGQQLKVVCIGRDMRGNLKLSRKAAMSPEEESAIVIAKTFSISKAASGVLEKSTSLGNQIKSSVSEGFLKQTSEQRVRTSSRVEEVIGDVSSSLKSDMSRGTVEVTEEVSVSTSTESTPSTTTTTTTNESHKRRRASPASTSLESTSDEGSSSPKTGLRTRRPSIRTKAKSNGANQEPSFGLGTE